MKEILTEILMIPLIAAGATVCGLALVMWGKAIRGEKSSRGFLSLYFLATSVLICLVLIVGNLKN